MKNIEEFAAHFLKHCIYEKNLSPKTLKSYGIDLKQFTGFIIEKKHSSSIQDIDKIVIREYIQSISFLKPKSVKRKIATLKALFNFLEFDDRILVNPFRKMKIQIREPYRLPKVMNINEIEKIMRVAYNFKIAAANACNQSFKEKVRNVAVIELLFATGVRVSELSELRREWIDLATGIVKVKGKGNKERIITVCNKETLNALKEYYSVFNKTIDASSYFFVNRLNRKLSEQSIRYLVASYAKIAGLERRITPHAFRHTFATLLLEGDVDIKYIQQFLGHSSIITTQIYTHVNSEIQKEILSTKHPRRNFEINKKPALV